MTMLLEPKDAAQLTCLRVVHGHELEGLTRRGWKVVETIITSEPVDVLIPMSEAERQARGHHPSSGGTYYDGMGQVPYGMVRSKALGTVCTYLVGHPTEDALADLGRELEAALQRASDAEQDNRKAMEQVKTAADDLKKMTTSHERCTADRDGYHKRVLELDGLRRKLEGDIGKIRIALGDLRMKEILEGTAK